jgi:hypothetical protein
VGTVQPGNMSEIAGEALGAMHFDIRTTG